MSKNIRFFVIAIWAMLGVTACGQGDNAAESGDSVAGKQAQLSKASVPTVQDKIDMLERFRDAPVQGCSKEFREHTDNGGDFDGATLQICRGTISSEEPYAIVLITGGTSQYKDGSMTFIFSAHPHPGAYSELRDMLVEASGIGTEAEEHEFNAALNRYMIAGPNMPGSDFRPLFQTKAGVEMIIGPNAPQSGWLTVRLNP